MQNESDSALPPSAPPRNRLRLHQLLDLYLGRVPATASLWREHLFFRIFPAALLLGIIAHAVQALIAPQSRPWLGGAVTTAAYAVGAVLSLARGIPWPLRAGAGLSLLYLLGILCLVALGPAGSGQMWLLAFALLTSLLFGRRSGLAAMGMGACAFVTVAALMYSGWRPAALPAPYPLGHWITSGLAFLSINAVVAIGLGVFLDRLEEVFGRQQAEASELESANERLTREHRERRVTELKRRGAQERWRVLFEEAPEAYFLSDPSGRLTDANRAVETLTGYRKEELIGGHLFDPRTPPADATPPGSGHRDTGDTGAKTRTGQFNLPAASCGEASTARNGAFVDSLANPAASGGEGALYLRFTLRTKGGGLVPVALSIRSVAIDGKLEVLSIARDLTEHKQAESHLRRMAEGLERRVAEGALALASAHLELEREIAERRRIANALHENQAKYRHLVEHAPAGFFELDLENLKLLSVNDVICETLGYSQAEMRTIDPLSILSEESRMAAVGRIANVLARRNISDAHEYKVTTREGRELWVLTNTRVVHEKGKPTRAITVVHDITQLKTLEIQLMQAQKMEAIGTLAGGIAHDFNNLLMAIQGFTTVLLFGTDPSDPRFQTLKSIEQTVGNGKKLTQQILGYARRGSCLTQPMALNPIVRETAETVGRTHKDITVDLELAEDLPAIHADETQMLQVLLNLFVNAVEAMPAGGRLRATTSQVTHEDIRSRMYVPNPGRYVKLTVADSGEGMDPKTRKCIFEPFFTTKKMGRGTGLGLASVYGIVKAHSGYIEVESEVQRGSAFHVYLPATDQPLTDPSKPVETVVRGSGTVLLVDDHQDVLKANAGMIASLGYEVIPVDSGREAIRIFGEQKEGIDLVVLDMVMPEMGGEEVFRRMKAIDPHVKVLLSSGYSLSTRIEDMLARGCRGFIQKPHGIEVLSAEIKAILGGEVSRRQH
jgi:PAS domain S-box-containing protein